MLQGWEILFAVLGALRHHSSREPPAFHCSSSASGIIGAVLGLGIGLRLRLGSSQQPSAANKFDSSSRAVPHRCAGPRRAAQDRTCQSS
jgi:hypothetical protein